MTITQKNMFKKAVLLLLFLSFQCIDAQITLTNNVGTTLVKTGILPCDETEGWSRVFKLSDFGIKPNEQFIIKSGQIGLSKSNITTYLNVTIYSIDAGSSDFLINPYNTRILGTGSLGKTPIINGAPEIVQAEFDTPIVVPAGIDRILVSISKTKDYYDPTFTEVLVAGTAVDKGVSLYNGCGTPYTKVSTKDLTIPVPNANFYINVTGEVFNPKSTGATTRLSHNICDDVIETDIHSCYGSGLYWARDFTLKDFGISNNEEFVITSGQVGINKANWGTELTFNIYKIDNNFPASFSTANLIGSSQTLSIPYVGSDRNSRVIQIDFATPIVVPAGVDKILVEVYKGLVPNSTGLAFIAGSAQDNGISWQRTCTNVAGGPTFGYDEYVNTEAFGKPNANFYINVTGNVKNVSNHFEMNFSNICSEFLKEFSIDDQSKIASIVWDFGDPDSGVTNTSNDLSPFHDFSADGTYTVTATVTGIDGTVEFLSETIDVKEPPKAYGINNVYACENSFNSGISSSFDVSQVIQQVLGGQIDKDVTFVDGNGNKYSSLPYRFANTIRDRETITVRVSQKDNLCCYSETTFDLIINPLPDLTSVSDISVCDNETDGFALFNLQTVETSIIGTATNIKVEFYHENGRQIQTPFNAIRNVIANEEITKVKAINTDTNCYNESTFKLLVNPLPVANILEEIIGCDDNNDGISEYFDTSNIKNIVLGNQTGMEVTYFDVIGNQLPSPLPNPYTNSISNNETLTVRVTNPLTNCYSDTPLVLETATQPQINKPSSRYACDEGNGFASFDTSTIETEIIGNQSGLKIMYFDSNGKELPSPFPGSFKNAQSWFQTIQVKVANAINGLCYSETSFDLKVNDLPSVNIEKTYYLCNLEASLLLSVANNLDSYKWQSQDGSIISNTYEANLVNSGDYILTVSKLQNGVYCENSFGFELIRFVLPSITDIKYKELSENNFIEIIAAGDGDFEYSIDGINYQDSNYFSNIQGGIYTAYARDKLGCGEDSKEVTVIDYPKFFTPNNDGQNDLWHIKGIKTFPNSKISIFDRYGKLLKEMSPNDVGWNGFFNGKEMPSSDYWFSANLNNGVEFSGHFTLKR